MKLSNTHIASNLQMESTCNWHPYVYTCITTNF